MADERELRVARADSAIAVEARRHTWVALLGPEGELARELSGSPRTTFAAGPGRYLVQTDGELVSVDVERQPPPPGLEPVDPTELALLRVTSDAPDRHVVDGVGELPADGTSWCAIAIEKLDAAGAPLHRRRDNDEVFLRTTGGTLADARGRRVRSVRLRDGRAQVRLVSEPVPRLVTVEAVANAPLTGSSVRVEFV